MRLENAGVPVGIAELLSHDVHAHELGPAVTETNIREIADAILRSGRSILSLEGGCPIPGAEEWLDRRAPSLSSLESEERNSAVRRVTSTLEWAARFEARAVVIRAGTTVTEFPWEIVHALRGTPAWQTGHGTSVRDGFLEKRRRPAGAHLDALSFSLEALLEQAERVEVPLALANPGEPNGMPFVNETVTLQERFASPWFGSWLDLAHAHRLERLGFEVSFEVKAVFEETNLGGHLHDLRDLEEGLPPGEGEIDFTAYSGLDDRPLVIRCLPVESERIDQALTHLRNLGLEGPPPQEANPFPIIGG